MRKHLPFCLILLLSVFLRFYALGASSLWSDEGNTWALMERSYAQIATDAAADIHPPGYYWLLKSWTQLFGRSAIGMRSFSAVTGALLVWAIYLIGLHLPAPRRWTLYNPAALLAALAAALNPLQVYYSQEARMYMLLALEGALLFWTLLLLLELEQNRAQRMVTGRRWVAVAAGYALVGSAGLWTHYSFPILLAAAGAAYLFHWALLYRATKATHPIHAWFLWRFLLLNVLIALIYLPWLPTALERVMSWPKGGASTSLGAALQATLQLLTFGPLRNVSESSWSMALGFLPLWGAYTLWRSSGQDSKSGGRLLVMLLFWLSGPILAMFVLGLYSEAFLKFLLSASPAWLLLSAAALGSTDRLRRSGTMVASGVLAALFVALALYTLPSYYADPTARDNYAGVAQYIEAVGEPERDLVVLNAPGQQEVWRYYNVSVPALALPQQRPADPQQTIEVLSAAAAERHSIFALFWATDEADPNRIVESWLDQHAFKGIESWQGNLRFVSYTLADELRCKEFGEPPSWQNQFRLVEWCYSHAAPAESSDSQVAGAVEAGQVALIRLHWQAPIRPLQDYTVSVQLLNTHNQLIAQHDSAPAGGSRPTTSWAAGEIVPDNHGLAIPPGTPPGRYHLIALLYDAQTNERVQIGSEDYLMLGEVEVKRMESAVPLAVMPIQHRQREWLGPVQFVGYDLYKEGFAHARRQPLLAGDTVHVTLYWQAPAPLPTDWPSNLEFTLQLGGQTLSAPLAGTDYATARWQSNEFVRGEFSLLFDGTANRPQISIGGESLMLAPVP